MLTIRPAQMEAFAQAAFRNFEDRMIGHLERFAPGRLNDLEEVDIRRAVRYGWGRARSHNLTSERSVRLYVEAMLMLGSDFDVDPQFPWAAEALDDEAAPDETARIDGLSDRAWDYVNHVLPDAPSADGAAAHQRPVEELRRLPGELRGEAAPSSNSEFYSRTLLRLNRISPERCERAGELNLRRLIRRGAESAGEHGLASERGVVLYVALTLVLGSGLGADPLLPWASAILADQSIADEDERIDQLHAAAVARLARWWG